MTRLTTDQLDELRTRANRRAWRTGDVGALLREIDALREETASARELARAELQRETHRRIVAAWDACGREGRPFELRHAVGALDSAREAIEHPERKWAMTPCTTCGGWQPAPACWCHRDGARP